MEPLTDRFGRTHQYLRISVTSRCNLRCLYCMPPNELAAEPAPRREPQPLTFDEIVRLAALLTELGIDKIRLTGGEPLVRRNLIDLVGRLAQQPRLRTLGLTTNGLLLAAQAGALRQAGLTHLNISLDTLRADRFRRIAGRGGFERVLARIEAALEAGFRPLKLNCVLMRGINDDEILDFVEFVRERPIQMRFIEYMPFLSKRQDELHLMPGDEIRQLIARRHKLEPLPAPPEAGSHLKAFRVEGHQGSIGFIAAISDRFCAACNRIRLMADGNLKTCLCDPPALNLRDALRAGATDAQLERLIREALQSKRRQHDLLTAEACAYPARISMAETGG